MLLVLLMLGLAALLTVPGSDASACGGFFCTTTPIDQSGERIIFTVNGDNTITAVVGIEYAGAAEDFSWLLPVPSVPTLDVADTISIDLLQQATTQQYTQPQNLCDGLYDFMGGFGGGGGDGVITGNVGPYDYAILDEDDVDFIVDWLRTNGYQVTDPMIPLIAHYVAIDMLFLAMKLSQDAEVGDIQPVVLTYESVHPMIPLRLTAVASTPAMPVLVWIFGEAQYVPENYVHAAIDYGAFRGGNQILDIYNFNGGGFFGPATGPFSSLTQERRRIQDEFDGRAFVTEYAAPTSELVEEQGSLITGDPLLADLTARYPYITRLRAQLDPEQMTIDPTFVPLMGAPDVPLTVDLGEHVDPLQYWGCSTVSLQSSAVEDLLPQYSLIDGVQVGYPAGWVIDTISWTDLATERVYVVYTLSPEAVTFETLLAFVEGEETPPVLLLYNGPNWFYDARSLFTTLILHQEGQYVELDEQQVWVSRFRPDVFGEIDGGAGNTGVFASLLTTRADWEANQTRYEAMLDYVGSYAYYAHPGLRHALFLGDSEFFTASENPLPRVQVGFPAGWIEFLDRDGTPTIRPATAVDDPDAPSIRLIPVTRFDPAVFGQYGSVEVLAAVAEAYDIDQATLDEWIADFEDSETRLASACTLTIEPMEYTLDGRRGFIAAHGSWLVEVSATEATFEGLVGDLRKVADSLRYGGLIGCG
jgi:hypothetical protein